MRSGGGGCCVLRARAQSRSDGNRNRNRNRNVAAPRDGSLDHERGGGLGTGGGAYSENRLRLRLRARIRIRTNTSAAMLSTSTKDTGRFAYRELDGALGLTEMGVDSLQDSGLGQNKPHGLLPCSGNPSTAAWRAARMSTTRSDSVSIPPCGMSSAASPIARDIRFWTANRRVRGKSPAVLLTWKGRCRSERIRAEPIWEIPDEQHGCKHLPR